MSLFRRDRRLVSFLRLAGWPDDKPVWTGSCPCQPFSAAGKGDGFADERHPLAPLLPSHQRAQTSACLWRTGCSR
ncbi:DNA cytosine methyltransferase [Klebsiella pneumoniae subsp. pneumoniae]|nr:DNA cytosine methyltransferase [Klebsiella pneumoniae subsp. pneumoniae]